MNDFEMNPMKTGLMFVPLGRASHPDFPCMSNGRGHLAEIEAELEAVIDPGAQVETEAPQPSMLHRLLNYFRRLAPELQQPSPNSV